MRSKSSILRAVRREWMRNYVRPKMGIDRRLFDQASIHNWAIREILTRIEKADVRSDRTDMDIALTIVEDFINKMDKYSCANSRNSHWFSIAKGTGEWVLDVLLSLT